jgi:GH15 family glucan-1,4-alpha-glucosidase
MCWVALDRALALTDLLDADAHVPAWEAAATEIRAAVETQGWDPMLGAFTQSFDSQALDATALLIPIVGFPPPDDARVASSIDAIGDRLTDGRGLVHRYQTGSDVDGLDGDEGTILLCTFWLAHALALTGRIPEGTEVFERAASYANDVGLLAEEVDSTTGELLGNFPQAFSHVGLVNAAWALNQATRSASADPAGGRD